MALVVVLLWLFRLARGKWLPVVGALSASAAVFLAVSDYVEQWDLTTRRWSEEKANAWYSKQGWMVGANFLPSTASNQLEMFQHETFDPNTIDRELGIAATMGMNTMRVFLHDLLFDADPDGFVARLDAFLGICAKHKIRPLLVFFDSCWDPYPKIGKQQEPIPGVHNSRWVKSPSWTALADPTQFPRLEHYVRSVIHAFKSDPRIFGWDMWNEPGNGSSQEQLSVIADLLPRVFQWAREEGVTQPLTCGVWGDIDFDAFQLMQIDLSDFISFHNYAGPDLFELHLFKLQFFNRPLVCTEWMARPHSIPSEILPIAKRENVAMINWGLVDGRMQTKFPWDSVGHPYDHEPEPWFHDLFHPDGTPYRREEYDLFKRLLGQ
ncbi:hypothetical protein HDU98_012358 [Podochytrium sp. JEL0797]|nr:hypothetical protein HDU98_012358 [Podochytrium sp. JEL0797]